MIISETEGFAFVHNPKCAGTSVREALRRYDTTGDFFWMFDDWNGKTIDKAHLPLFVLRSKYPAYFAIFQNLFSFTFVRNPYERLISAFNESSAGLYNKSVETENFADYKIAINRLVMTQSFHLQNLLEANLQRFIQQRHLVFLGSRRLVDISLKVEEWPGNLRKLGVFNKTLQTTLEESPRLHQRPMTISYRDLLSRQSIDKLNHIYEADFLLFDYEMDSA